MLTINCPYCGPRLEPEFRCAGESHIQRPQLDCTDEEWAAYLFMRANPRGSLSERWLHAAGCGQWFNVIRDTRDHEILAIYAITDPRPRLEPAA